MCVRGWLLTTTGDKYWQSHVKKVPWYPRERNIGLSQRHPTQLTEKPADLDVRIIANQAGSRTGTFPALYRQHVQKVQRMGRTLHILLRNSM